MPAYQDAEVLGNQLDDLLIINQTSKSSALCFEDISRNAGDALNSLSAGLSDGWGMRTLRHSPSCLVDDLIAENKQLRDLLQQLLDRFSIYVPSYNLPATSEGDSTFKITGWPSQN